ncbi:hypothetical protein [Pelagibacterium lentulum]|uniref:hypothetical protein n=1 Tax=Pelagibacterium lentulum TaxID=2029865 RepID=UPI0013DEB480|nr:hypothetical protein [Pelagibacterium lentulum]
MAAWVPVAMVSVMFGIRAELRGLAMGTVRNLSPVYTGVRTVSMSGPAHAAVLD